MVPVSSPIAIVRTFIVEPGSSESVTFESLRPSLVMLEGLVRSAYGVEQAARISPVLRSFTMALPDFALHVLDRLGELGLGDLLDVLDVEGGGNVLAVRRLVDLGGAAGDRLAMRRPRSMSISPSVPFEMS